MVKNNWCEEGKLMYFQFVINFVKRQREGKENSFLKKKITPISD